MKFAGLNAMATQMSLLNVRNRSNEEEMMAPKVEEEDEQIYNKSRSSSVIL